VVKLRVANGKVCRGNRFQVTETQKNLSVIFPEKRNTGSVKKRLSSFDIEKEEDQEEMQELGKNFMTELWG